MSLVSFVGLLNGKSNMRVIFSDECGMSGKDPLTVVTAILLNLDNQYEPLLKGIDEALITAFHDVGKATECEIKGDRLIDDLCSGREKAKYAEQLVPALLSLPFKHQFPIFYGAVDNKQFKANEEHYKALRESFRKILRKSPRISVSFGDCLRRVNTYVATAYPGEKYLWIHDQGGPIFSASHFEVEFYRVQEIIRTHLAGNGQQGISYGGGRAGFTLPTPSIPIVDTVYFGDSANSRLLQLADLCCTTVTAHLLSTYGYINSAEKKACLASFYPLIKPQVINDGTSPIFYQVRR